MRRKKAALQNGIARYVARIYERANVQIVLNQLVNSAGNFLLTVALVRWLGLTQFGIFTAYFLVAQAITSISAALVTMPAISLSASMSTEPKRQLLSTSIVLSSMVCVLCIILVAIFQLALITIPTPIHVELLAFTAFLLATTVTDSARRLSLYLRYMWFVWALDGLRFGLAAILLSLQMLMPTSQEQSVQAALVLLACAHALPVIPALLIAKMSDAKLKLKLKLGGFAGHAKRIVRAGSWLSVSAALQYIYDNTFIFVGFVLAGPNAVGIVRTSQAIVGLVHPFFFALEHFIPRLIGQSALQRGWPEALAEYDRIARSTGLGLMALVLGIAVLAEPLTALTMGQEAAGHAWVTQVVCATYFPIIVFTLLTFPARALNRTRVIAKSVAASTALAAVIAIPLVAYLNVAGVVLGMFLVQTTGAVLLFRYYDIMKKEINQRRQPSSN